MRNTERIVPKKFTKMNMREKFDNFSRLFEMMTRTGLPAGGPPRGSDMPPACHSLPLGSSPDEDERIKTEMPRLAAGHLCFGDPYGTRTHVTAVKGRCLNHLTNGPMERRSATRCALNGSGTWIRTGDTSGMNRMLWPTELCRHLLPKQQKKYNRMCPACQHPFCGFFARLRKKRRGGKNSS